MNGKRKKIITAAVAVVLILGSYFAYESYMYVSTDNANVQAKTTLISSKISGIVVKAGVDENQKVKSGDLLVELKPEDYQATVDQLEAERASLETQLKNAEKSYNRAKTLLKHGASTQERFDTAEAMYLSLQEKLKAATAQVDQAKINLGYTRILAPADGRIGRKSFEVGMLANPGQPLLGFVEGDERWVVANVKETELSSVKIGQKVYVDVDAVPGHTFQGQVESISPTTGATFSLLPPDNATGNFTKVVQHVPVRVRLLNLSETDVDRLQSGLSAYVKIRVH